VVVSWHILIPSSPFQETSKDYSTEDSKDSSTESSKDSSMPGSIQLGRSVKELAILSYPDTHINLTAFLCGGIAALAAALVPYYSGLVIDYASIEPERCGQITVWIGRCEQISEWICRCEQFGFMKQV
jgi:hypothetical protein